MKNSVKLLGIIALVAVIGFSFAACGGDDDNGGNGGTTPQTVTYTGTSGGTTYTLIITENTAYVLTLTGTGGTKTSSGTVENTSGGNLTLKPSNAAAAFTATVSGSSLTALNGTITYTDNTTDNAPGELTPPVVPPVGGTGGTFTLTGIPSQYNGKYALLSGTDELDGSDDYMLYGCQSINMAAQTATLSPISNGSVSIPMWKFDESGNGVRYSGTGPGAVAVQIFNTQTYSELLFPIYVIYFENVPFSNGNASRTWSQGEID